MSQADTISTPALRNGGVFPERGQLVEVRRRQWIVDDVGASAFRELFATSRQGLVSLVSVDEDESCKCGSSRCDHRFPPAAYAL